MSTTLTFSTSSSLFVRRIFFRKSPISYSRRGLAVSCTAAPAVGVVPTGKRMSSAQIREQFLAFYERKQHERRSSASLIPDDPTILLTIAGMVPFKPIFLGIEPAPVPPRLVSAQKCLRTNDIENVGVTKRHHTFFEMLGNFSFGDYFKREAIAWAWELLTDVYQIPKERLVVSIFENDDESFYIWRDVVGIDENRIMRMSAEHNFWAVGPTGPCGPCSEIYYDFDPLSNSLIDLEDDSRFIELYNLVFMQYSRESDGQLIPLSKKNIDTGMGLERMAQVLQNVDNNYETDLIRPIMDLVASIAGLSFDAATNTQKTSLKVVGDHIRAVAHLIADGVQPSNIGRGYIVRRLIRRVVRHGRMLGVEGSFISDILPVVAELASEAGLNNVQENLDKIQFEVTQEEDRFLRTLIRGESRLEELLSSVSEKNKTLPGEDAFELYDTYGFPFELTEEIALENGISVDRNAFDKCMTEQRNRARAARDSGSSTSELSASLAEASSLAGSTEFNGYTTTRGTGVQVSAIVLEKTSELSSVAKKGDRVRLLLNQTPFYAEGGGQVGDTGVLKTGEGGIIQILDTKNEFGSHVHVGEIVEGAVKTGDLTEAIVDATSRRRIMAHHTSTHLLQSALKKVLNDENISQAGSLVDSERLRFDFNFPRAVSGKELLGIENLINKWIDEGHLTEVSHMTLEMAKEAGAVAMFGEKYDTDSVRVVNIPGVSMELCGGTHVNSTGDIGLFKIISESGPSAGVRRIEAVCGAAVLPYLRLRDEVVRNISTSLKSKPEDLPKRITMLQEELRSRSKELDTALEELAVAKALSHIDSSVVREFGKYLVVHMDGKVSSDGLKAAAERTLQELGPSSAVVLASSEKDKVAFVAAVGSDAQKNRGLKAGQLVGAIAKMCGGGGGGRPGLAQAGGRDSSKLSEALRHAKTLLEDAFQNNGPSNPR